MRSVMFDLKVRALRPISFEFPDIDLVIIVVPKRKLL